MRIDSAACQQLIKAYALRILKDMTELWLKKNILFYKSSHNLAKFWRILTGFGALDLKEATASIGINNLWA